MNGSYANVPSSYNFVEVEGTLYPALMTIGTLLPNGYGIHDLYGNVSEWIWDSSNIGYPSFVNSNITSDGINLAGGGPFTTSTNTGGYSIYGYKSVVYPSLETKGRGPVGFRLVRRP